jgi:hypothetical protein
MSTPWGKMGMKEEAYKKGLNVLASMRNCENCQSGLYGGRLVDSLRAQQSGSGGPVFCSRQCEEEFCRNGNISRAEFQQAEQAQQRGFAIIGCAIICFALAIFFFLITWLVGWYGRTTANIRNQESELAAWIEESCGISNGLKELVEAFRAMGVEKTHDLRFMAEAMLDGLTGMPIIQREKLRECIRRVKQDL